MDLQARSLLDCIHGVKALADRDTQRQRDQRAGHSYKQAQALTILLWVEVERKQGCLHKQELHLIMANLQPGASVRELVVWAALVDLQACSGKYADQVTS